MDDVGPASGVVLLSRHICFLFLATTVQLPSNVKFDLLCYPGTRQTNSTRSLRVCERQRLHLRRK
jgi:hypothetical protein